MQTDSIAPGLQGAGGGGLGGDDEIPYNSASGRSPAKPAYTKVSSATHHLDVKVSGSGAALPFYTVVACH